MKYSIEARSPFLNKKLFEYVNSFHRNELINKMKSKKILRNFLYKNKMGYIAKAKKKGFTIPLALWINNELRNEINDLLGSNYKDIFRFINYDYFKKLISEHFAYKRIIIKNLVLIRTT